MKRGAILSAPPVSSKAILPKRLLFTSGNAAVTVICPMIKFLYKRRAKPPSPFLLAPLVTIATGAVLAITGVAHMDLIEHAVHAVAVKPAFGYAARNAAIHIPFHMPLLLFQYYLFPEKYLDKRHEIL